jgi:prepilin-type processing-associated H-X9-DG protein
MVSTNWNPTNTSGSLEFTNSAQVFRHFQAASNELNNPIVLRCPSDDGRQKTRDFSKLANNNLSYFVGLDAVETNPELVLSGDRNITGGTLVNSNLLLVRPNSLLSWTKAIHTSQGNVGLADGSVQQVTVQRLNQQIAAMTNPVIRLAIP